ncbi:YihY/virulence factor BrkB family protein [Chryseolinea sp. H1M3-3]|uniref:YihY/virulence factor BrkB family protein n=1 Tax=Chryseolinea sp. H1M3-3 TaxID=3034144 RepID=UPI0023EC2F9D|nr:YihY/virulence factor BrkB family protein [Chryseolinea sp. H1M3-3]
MESKKIYGLFRNAFVQLKSNEPLILASATAFFTLFSLTPILVVLVNILSILFRNSKIAGKLFQPIEKVFGAETSEQIKSIVENVKSFGGDWYITVGGFIFLLFVATNLLNIIKKSINQLWRIRKSTSKKIRYNLRERSIAILLILSIGFLFIISLLLDTSVAFLQGYVTELIPSVDAILIRTVNIIFSVLVVTAWFTILYKILPDAIVHWKVALVGGLLTAVLFTIGKWILGHLLDYSNMVSIFGAFASVFFILLFIFYSSLILYYGASFTYGYASETDRPIKPRKHSDSYEVKIVSSK